MIHTFMISSVQFSSVAQLCPTLFDPMNHSTPGFLVHHQLPEFTQTHVHQVSWVSEVAQSCQTLCDPVDCSPPGSSVHGILQARILEWIAISFSRGSSRPRDWTQVSCIAGRRFNLWATREALPVNFHNIFVRQIVSVICTLQIGI